MSNDIKARFGKHLRAARDAKKISRATLGVRLGVSPKTIQSWEMGRTFIEDLSLVPSIEAELDISVWELASNATSPKRANMAAEASPRYGGKRRSRLQAGPLPAIFEIHSTDIGKLPESETLGGTYVSVPLVRPQSIAIDVDKLSDRDVRHHVIAPAEWIPRGGVIIACRMGDSGMSPMIPLGGIVLLDRRPLTTVKAMNRVVPLEIKGKGVRIRRLIEDPDTGHLVGATCLDGQRGKAPFRPNQGDRILGRAIGILAQPV